MTQQHGRAYENYLVKQINEHTENSIVAVSVGYSGNDKHSFADLVVISANQTYFIEVKKRNCETNKRTTVFGETSDGRSGLQQVETLIEKTPSYAESYIIVKWDRRVSHTFKASALMQWLDDDTDGWYPQSARLTPSDHISIRKPTTDEWPTAQSRDDITEVAQSLQISLTDD
jgi:Holliday junction resolvase